MNKAMKFNLFCALLLAGVTFVSCKPQTQGARPQATHPTMKVALADKIISEEYSAMIQSDDYVEVRPQVSGTITKILVDDGETVKKGEILFVIDQVPYVSALETAVANRKSAEARVNTAQLKMKSSEELYKENVVSEYDLATSRNSLAEAEAALAVAKAQEITARNNLSYTEVKSPYDGVASHVPYNVGALVSSGISEPLVTITALDKMYARFSLSEEEMLNLTREYGSTSEAIKDMPAVSLILGDGKPYNQHGKIDAISGVVDRSTGSVMFRAVFPNPDGILRDGGVGRVVLSRTYDNALVIPKEATFEIQTRVFAYKVVNGVATAAVINVLPLDGGREYIVTSGLKAGDEIIAKGAGLVREGTPVKPAKGGASMQGAKPAQQSKK